MMKTSKATSQTAEREVITLSDNQLDNVTGGVKVVDAASPNLFMGCATGKHFQKASSH